MGADLPAIGTASRPGVLSRHVEILGMTNADESQGFSNQVDAQIEHARELADLLNDVVTGLIATDDDDEADEPAPRWTFVTSWMRSPASA